MGVGSENACTVTPEQEWKPGTGAPDRHTIENRESWMKRIFQLIQQLFLRNQIKISKLELGTLIPKIDVLSEILFILIFKIDIVY